MDVINREPVLILNKSCSEAGTREQDWNFAESGHGSFKNKTHNHVVSTICLSIILVCNRYILLQKVFLQIFWQGLGPGFRAVASVDPYPYVTMFLGLLDPDPLVRGKDPDPSIIKQKK